MSNKKCNCKSCHSNQWASVEEHYDIKESCCKHEKTATDNQWCCCCKNSIQDKEE